MAIWTTKATPEELTQRSRGTMIEHLGIEFTALGEDSITGRMPVDARTHQPDGILHGGASVALAETLGSTAGALTIDRATKSVVGLEINANHVRACRAGFVEGVARPLHLGRSTQIWETTIRQDGKLVCVSRLTLAVIDRA
jgi:1,4-dihydroxy-2-naphthoyl-CoA hydrolase